MTRDQAPRVVLITDPAYALEHAIDVVTAAARALPRGAFAVQLRDKFDDARRATWGMRLAPLLHDFGGMLIVNADASLARDLELARPGLRIGLHVPRFVDRGGASFVSVPVHDTDEATRAARDGADAVLASPIFSTPNKGAPRGVGFLTEVRAAAPNALLYALGGVDASNAAACAGAGADGVAVIRALLDAPSPGPLARALFDGVASRG